MPSVQQQIGAWCRAAAAWHDWQGAKFCRFGDNMREVAVTEGDKVSAQMQFGYSVNGYGVGDLVKRVNAVTDSEIDQLVARIRGSLYRGSEAAQERPACGSRLREAARIELGLRAFLNAGRLQGLHRRRSRICTGWRNCPGWRCSG